MFIQKAQNSLLAAELLLANGWFDEVANRAYYAAFHAARAALEKAGISTDGLSHERIQAEFARTLIHRQKFYPGYLKSYLLDLQGIRNDADYKSVSVSKTDATRALKKSQEFVRIIQQRLQST